MALAASPADKRTSPCSDAPPRRWLVACTQMNQAPEMRSSVDWLPGFASEHGPSDAKGVPEPGSRGAAKIIVSAEPGSHGAPLRHGKACVGM